MIALNLFLFVAIFTYVNHNYINKNNIDELLNIALKNDKLLLEKKYTNTINQLHTDSFLTFVDSNKALSFSDNKKTTFLYVGRNNCEFCQVTIVHKEKVNVIKNKLDQKKFSNLLVLGKCFSDSSRIKIFYALETYKEMCVCDLAEILTASVATTSHHLRF